MVYGILSILCRYIFFGAAVFAITSPSKIIISLIIGAIVGVADSIFYALGKRKPKEHYVPDNTETEETLLESYLNQVVDYCQQKGLSVLLSNRGDGIWLQKDDDNKNVIVDLMELPLPAKENLNPTSLKIFVADTCESLNEKINQINK